MQNREITARFIYSNWRVINKRQKRFDTRHTFARGASEELTAASFTTQLKLEAVRYFFRILTEVSLGTPTSLNDRQINGTATTIHFSRT